MASLLISEQLKNLPVNPGVYLMKRADGTILYVGKATSLRNRVRSYFGSKQGLTPKTEQLVSLIHDIDFFVTGSEQEAVILELNLIKQHRPHFNIRLKDDKSFPYLKIDINNEWPRVCITRRWEKDGARYFGPFASSWSVRQTLKMIKNIFPTRSCDKPITGAASQPCLEYHIKNCLGPCIGAVTKEEYDAVIRQIILFLEGKQEDVVKELKRKMETASAALNFELAARLRDQIQGVSNVIEAQRFAAKVKGEQDVIAFVVDRDQAYVQVFFIRNDRLIGRESFTLQGVRQEEPVKIMTGFVKQYYDNATYIPSLILLQHPIEDKTLIAHWLREKRGGRVVIEVPRRGHKKALMNTVAENARQSLEQMKIKQLAAPGQLVAALAELQKELKLAKLPERIEGYDISNIQGQDAVGSMVVFESGKSKSSHYRRFKIKTIPGANDFAMLQEVISRRFKRVRSEVSSEEWAVLPELVLIDGGKGQLHAVHKVMSELGVADIPVAGLAKEKEEIFVPGRSKPIILPHTSGGLQLLQRVRDEAHRFAIGYHRKVHKRETFTSVLDGISGIGPRRKRSLLRRFGSVRGIQQASVEELMTAEGMTRRIAENIKKQT
ncbi:MAG: excinuclease ABC subunit UvrC [Dehalococcoidales bacterium]|nr:excinuclease ABC subunit UvrC [Dehalococcoidales bacterium]